MKTLSQQIKVILMHAAFWCCFILFPITTAIDEMGEVPEQMLFRTLTAPLVFYINFSFLIPKLLLKKKVIPYVIVSVIFLLSINYLLINIIEGSPLDDLEKLVSQDNMESKIIKDLKHIVPFTFSLSVYLLGGIFKVILTYFQKEKESKELENQQKEMQIQFLRAQLNPHFLFNSLNSIYSLVRSKSKTAPEAVIALSELMRYMLYEVKDRKVALEKELDYIRNYIALQCLRLKDSHEVKSIIHGESSGLYIHPLLLISFIENAFKYGVDVCGNTGIEIYINIEDGVLHLNVKNVIGIQKNKSKESESGIGLKNVKSQLKHLYLGNYKLNINQKEGNFIVDLILKLK